MRATLPQLAAELDRRGAEGQPFFLVDAIDHLLSQRPEPKEGEKPNPVFRSLRGGYASLVDALVRHANPELLRNTAVESIGRTRGGYYIAPIGEFAAVIVATPAPTVSAILQYMAPTAADVLGEIDLASSVVVGMRMASAHGIPERSGVLLGSDAPTEAKAFTFSSRKWPHLAERGGAFVRASFGSFGNPWHLEVDNRALLSFAVEDLERITGERKTPEEYFVQRWWGGLPRYGVGYMDAMSQAYDEVLGIRGLALAGSMLNGVGVPATAASGVEAAREIIREMA